MTDLVNENILKLIFDNFYLPDINKIFANTKNKTLIEVLLKVTAHIFTIIKNSKITLNKSEYQNQIHSLISLPNDNIISLSENNDLKVWDIHTLQCIQAIENFYPVSGIIVDDNLFTANNNKIKVWNTKANEFNLLKVKISESSGFYNIYKLTDKKFACTILNGTTHSIHIFECYGKMTCVRILNKHTDWISSLVSISSSGFATGSADRTIKLWDIGDKESFATLEGHKDRVSSLVFVSKNNWLLSGSNDKTIKIWNTLDNKCLMTIVARFEILQLVLLPYGYIASGCNNGDLEIWDLKYYRCLGGLRGNSEKITCLLLLKDNRLASACYDGKVTIWDMAKLI
jgi:WD40 repeat protein